MATPEKPTALQSAFQKNVKEFESYLAPEEEKPEGEEVEENAESIDEESEEIEDDDPQEEAEEEIAEEEEQPDLYTVKIDGIEQQVTLQELQQGYSRQQDYTRKTQELSNLKKEFQQQQSELSQRDAVYSQLLPKMEAQIKGDLENEPDWQKLSEEDPIAYVREKQIWDQKQERLRSVEAERQRLEKEAVEKQQQKVLEMIQHGQQKLLELIPEWSDDKVAAKEKVAIREYAINVLGYTPQEMDQVYDYRALLGLRSAWLQSQTAEATKKKPTQKASVRAGKPGSSTRKVSVAPEKKLRQKLRKTGKTQDAAKVFEHMLSKR
jgi:hypothetical protein